MQARERSISVLSALNSETDYIKGIEYSNWCSTDFIVTGPVEEISRFRKAVRGSDNNGETPFDFDRVIPMPSELNGHDCRLGWPTMSTMETPNRCLRTIG